MTLRDRTYSAIRWTTAGAVFRVVLQVAQVSVLARLLRPEDYGLMAMVAVVLSFAWVFADLGVSAAFVQKQTVTPEQRSSLFWLNLAVSAGLTVAMLALSPVLAWFFGDDRLVPLIMLSSVTFVLTALGQQVKMAAEKDLDFRPVMLLEMVTAILGLGVAVALALAGWGVYALVVSGIFSSIVGSALAWRFLARGWRPGWRLRREDVRPFLGFGSALIGNKLINQVLVTVDIILGGRLLSASQLGLYSVPRNLAFQVQNIINPIITRVGFPLIAQVQADLDRVRSIYLKTMSMTAATNAPIYLGAAAFAPECVAVLLGPGWEPAGELLRLLALWGGLRALGNPVGSLLLGMGRADLSLRWVLAVAGIILPAIAVGSLWAAAGMAWALLLLQVGLFVPAWFFLVRPLCRAGLLEYTDASLRPFVLAGLAIAPGLALSRLVDGAILRLVLGIATAVPLYLLLSVRLNREWIGAMQELLHLRRAS